jgi:O-antigen/teichoic acid export membrane protein
MFKKILQTHIIKEGFWYSFVFFFSQAINLAGTFLVARYLGPQNLGFYTFTQVFMAALSVFLSSFDTYGHWNIVKSEDAKKEATKYFLQKLILVGCILSLWAIVTYFILPIDIFILTLFLYLPFILSSLSPFLFILQYKKEMLVIGVITIISTLLLFFLKVLAIIEDMPVSTFIFINGLDTALILSISIVYFYKNWESFREAISNTIIVPADFISLFKKSFMSLLYMTLWYFVIKLDQLLIPFFFSTKDLGYYSAAVRVAEVANIFVIVLQTMIISRALQIKESKDINKIILVYGIIGTIVAILIYITSPLLVKIIYGPLFQNTVAILQVYIWTLPGIFIYNAYANLIISQGNMKLLFKHSIGIFTLTLTLLPLASKYYGITGVAFVSVITYSLSALILVIYSNYTKHI